MSLPLHDPTVCDCNQPTPRRCVPDLHAFAASILHQRLHAGVRTSNGYAGPAQILPCDHDRFINDLISHAWELAQTFNGQGRLAGFLVQRLHWHVTDLQRNYYGSTRYHHVILEPLTDEDRQHLASLVDLTAPEILDLVNNTELTPPRRRTLQRIVLPIVMEETSIEDYIRQSGKGKAQIRREIARLGRELEAKELLAA